MDQPQIIEQLRHCEAEFCELAKNHDVEGLKALFKREGVEWREFLPTETNKPDIWYGSCNPDNSDAPIFSVDPQNQSKLG